MTTDEILDFDYELIFDETECGSARYFYYGILTDCGNPADILVCFKRNDDYDNSKTKALARELVRRWNTRAAPISQEEALEALHWIDTEPNAPKHFNRHGNEAARETIRKLLQHHAGEE